jgi:galactarate dehydratase
MFSRVTEVRDAIDQLTRAPQPEVGRRADPRDGLVRRLSRRGEADRSANTTPGNKKGGLSNIVEKAMGSIVKSGTSADRGRAVAGREAAQKGPDLRGDAGQRLHLRHAAAGLRHERCTCSPPAAARPTGWPPVPVIKVATRSDLARRWHDLIDVDAGRIATGDATIEETGWESVPPDARRRQRPQEDLGRALEAAQRAGAVQPGAGDSWLAASEPKPARCFEPGGQLSMRRNL